MKKDTFSISGMHCAGCEETLHRAVSGLEGVRAVRASYARAELRVEYAPPCDREKIGAAVLAAGYRCGGERERKRSGVYLLVILLGLYVIARQLGLTELAAAFPVAGGERVGYAALLVIGLLTSVHCIAMCGGLNLSQSMTGEGSRPLRGSLLYNLGRLTSYTAIGAVLGAVGEAAAVTLRVRGLIGLFAGGLMVLMGVNLLGSFGLLRRLTPRLPAGLVRRVSAIGRHGPFSIGLVNGLMPCGPLQSMQLYAIASGGALQGALSMFFFCLGTIPLVLFFGAAAGALRLSWREKMLQFSAALLVVLGLIMLQNNLALTGLGPKSPAGQKGAAVQTAVRQGEEQYVTTYLRANGYDDLRVTAGVPVVWTVVAEEGSLNGCNSELVLPAFDRQVRLGAGETVITFTPEQAGSYVYSCWMGMLRNTITVVEP